MVLKDIFLESLPDSFLTISWLVSRVFNESTPPKTCICFFRQRTKPVAWHSSAFEWQLWNLNEQFMSCWQPLRTSNPALSLSFNPLTARLLDSPLALVSRLISFFFCAQKLLRECETFCLPLSRRFVPYFVAAAFCGTRLVIELSPLCPVLGIIIIIFLLYLCFSIINRVNAPSTCCV